MQRKMVWLTVVLSTLLFSLLPTAQAQEYQVSLRNSAGGYASAQSGGGGIIDSVHGDIGSWETFSLVKWYGGDLKSDDFVSLRAQNGKFVSVINGGGGDVIVNGPATSTWERLRVWDLSSNGIIRSGDPVQFETYDGHHLSADYRYSDARIRAFAPWVGSWEVFRISVAPPGYRLVNWGRGVQVYRKDFQGGWPNFVTIVNLNRGSIKSLTGSYINGRVEWLPQRVYWSNAQTLAGPNRAAIAVINGTYFNSDWWQGSLWTTLTLGLKVSGRVLSSGTAVGPHARSFCFDATSATIRGNPQGIYGDRSVSDAIGTYSWDLVGDRDNQYTGRTLLGIRDDNGDGVAETVLFFTSNGETKQGALSTLDGFGSRDAVQLDGGSSTMLTVQGTEYITSKSPRTVPHAIAIYGGR